MTARTTAKITAACLAGGAALAALGYAAYAAAAWTHYGHPTRTRRRDEEDPILDGFMPLYDIVERHHIDVDAPAALTLAAARHLDAEDSCIIRAVFRGRELMFGADPDEAPPPKGLLAGALAMGWGVLYDRGHEIVLGAVTRPWESKPVFRDLLPREFASFAEPGYVKIAFTLRADPIDEVSSVFRTETRAIATDMDARARFRKYWAIVSPGVALIRRAMLSPIKADAERQFVPAGGPADVHPQETRDFSSAIIVRTLPASG